ncbi:MULTISPECIES: hypothetical protein [Giesbergeria]|uniref:Uncharacterized protein n=1 Tax=Giesbergeria sinuosa TaxID=80883 RepID=A0ABV9QCL1_9BURK
MTSTATPIRFDRAASKRAQLLDALAFLYHQRQRPISPLELQAETGFTAETTNEILKAFRERGEVFTVGRGMYAPVVQHAPPRAVSLTMLHDGSAKLEVGDELLSLGPLEYRTLVRVVGGIASETAMLAAESNNSAKVSALAASVHRNDELIKRMADLLASVAPKGRPPTQAPDAPC